MARGIRIGAKKMARDLALAMSVRLNKVTAG
jgi:hypothetical protein